VLSSLSNDGCDIKVHVEYTKKKELSSQVLFSFSSFF
jgi:hypothetical protein